MPFSHPIGDLNSMAAFRQTSRRPRQPVSSSRIAVYLAIGVGLGLAVGYIFMGTAHAILETRGNLHYGHDDAKGGEQAKALGRGAAAGAATDAAAAKTDTGAAGTNTAAAAAAGGGGGGPAPGTIHTLCTGNGSPYQNYQIRIALATYKLTQAMPGGERHVAFTRILHRTKPDALMGEVDTFRAEPLQPKCDDWCDYPVSDRGNAVVQFFQAAEKDPGLIKGEWIYMVESDYVFMKPLPLPSAESQAKYQAWGYPFNYIQPSGRPGAMRQLYPEEKGPISDIPGTGPAPILMRANDWKKVAPDWEKYTATIEANEDLKKQLGWVREMYAFSVALANNKMHTELKGTAETDFIAQLPIDHKLNNAHAFHYTQCTIYKAMADNKDVWAFDKRFHTSLEESLAVPAIPDPPPYEEGKWKFVEGNSVGREVHETIGMMVAQMNRGIATLKPLTAVA